MCGRVPVEITVRQHPRIGGHFDETLGGDRQVRKVAAPCPGPQRHRVAVSQPPVRLEGGHLKKCEVERAKWEVEGKMKNEE
jgi:hypothetical protein